MSTQVDEIRLVVRTELEKAFADMKKMQEEAKKTGKETGTFIDGMKAGLKTLEGPTGKLPMAFGKIAAVVGAVVGAVTGFVVVAAKFADAASQQEQAMKKLEAVSKTTGTSFDEAKKAALALSSDGLLTFQESAQALSNLLASGLSLPKAIQLLQIAKDNAVTNRQSHLQLGEAVVTFTEGIRNQNSMLTDSVGITKNYAAILEEGAKALGISTEQLTKEQQAQIVANGFIKEGATFAGQAAKASDTYAGAKARAEAATKSLTIAIGTGLMPAMKSLYDILASTASQSASFFSQIFGTEAPEDRLKRLSSELKNLEASIASIRVGSNSRDKQRLGFLESQKTSLQEELRVQALLIQGDTGSLKLVREQIVLAKEQVAKEGEFYLNKTRTGGVVKVETEEKKKLVELQKEEAALVEKINKSKTETSPAQKSADVDPAILKAREIVAEIEKDKQNAKETTLKKAIEYGLLQYQSEKDLAGKIKTANVDALKKQVDAYEEAASKKKELIKEGLQLHVISEKEATTISLEEAKKRIEAHKIFIEILKQLFAGAKDIIGALFDFDRQNREWNLEHSLKALETEYNKKIELLDKSNEYTQQVSDFEKSLSQEKQAQRDADLQDELSKINEKLKSRIGKDEKEKLLDEKKKILKEIEDNNEEKRLNDLKEKEKQRAEEISQAKKAAEEDFQNKSKELKRQAAKKEHDAKVWSAFIDTQAAVVNALASIPFPGNLIAAGFVEAFGLLKMGLIAASPIPEYRTGINFVPSDRIAMLHEGERVMTREENKHYATNMGGVNLNFYGHHDPQSVVDIFDERMKIYGNLTPEQAK